MKSATLKLALALLGGVALAACGPEPVEDPCENVVCPGLTECREGQCVSTGNPPTGNDAGTKDGGTDAGELDGGEEMDAGELDGGEEMDAGEMDAGELDGGEEMDAGELDAGEPDAGEVDAGPSLASLQIEAVRMAASDGGLMLPIQGAYVTYVKPEVGADPEGFFLQADQTGPAIFVEMAGGTLPSAPAVGDVVDLEVNEVLQLSSGTPDQRRVTAFSNYVKQSGGNSVASLVQNISTATDVVSNLDGYESELVHATGTLAQVPGGAGSGHLASDFNTAGIGGDTSLEFRMPITVRDLLDLTEGCNITVDATPMWRFGSKAQISAWNSSEITVNSCPAPKLLSASTLGDSAVQLTFDRQIAAASATAGGFMFTNGLSATSATANGTTVVVDTSLQTAGASYTVTVGSSVTDTLGTSVDPLANSATFTGFTPPMSAVLINEVDYDNVGADTNEFVELHNPGSMPVSLTNVALIFVNGGNNSEYGTRVDLTPLVSIAPGEFIVVGTATLVATLPSTVRTATFANPQDNLQNGAPDAVALIDTSTNTVLDSLSYEGSATVTLVTGGTPIPLNEGGQSTTGVADSNSAVGSLCRIPDGNDTNVNATDFTFRATLTPGAGNQ